MVICWSVAYRSTRVAIFAVLLAIFCVSYRAQSGEIVGPRVLLQPEAAYPTESAATGIYGKILVRVLVDADGRVVEIEDASGPGWACHSVSRPDIIALRNAAEYAARRARFIPATRGGIAIAAIATLEYDFAKRQRSEVTIDLPAVSLPAKIVSDPNVSRVPNVVNGKAINLVKPRYPHLDSYVRPAGQVVLSLVIEPDGRISYAEPLSGDPPASRCSPDRRL